MKYQHALDFLYQFIPAQRTPAATPQAAAFKLARMRYLLHLLDHPEHNLRCLIVGGTNGKGSTCAFLEHMLRAAGYRTGLWTSPHLSSYRERIQVNRQLISREALVAEVVHLHHLYTTSYDHAYGTPLTFELGLALALRFFRAQAVEYAIIEVGLGGRYDSSNILTPLVAALSAIGYDHMDILGSTLTHIATDKAGIMKPTIPAVTVPQHPEAAAALAREATQVGVPLWIAAPIGLLLPDDTPPQPQPPCRALSYPVLPKPRLAGSYQHDNARLALGVAMLLREQGVRLPDEALAAGLHYAQWAGRMEVVAHAPLLVLDGAHNRDAALQLIAALRQAFTFQRLLLVMGVSRGGSFAGVIEVLVPHAAVVVLTHHATHPRAYADLEDLAAVVKQHLRGILCLEHEVGAAIRHARSLATTDDLICVTGSLFVVATAREVLHLVAPDDND